MGIYSTISNGICPRRSTALFFALLLFGLLAFFLDTKELTIYIPKYFFPITSDIVLEANDFRLENISLHDLGVRKHVVSTVINQTQDGPATGAVQSTDRNGQNTNGSNTGIIKVDTLTENTRTWTAQTDYLTDTNETCVPNPYVQCHVDLSNHSLTNETFGIAIWRRPYWLELRSFNFTNCRYSKCVFFTGKEEANAHLVLVYSVGINDNFHPKREEKQLYAAVSWESPVHTHASFLHDSHSYWNSAFNLTANYRIDSDIFVPYARLLFQPEPSYNRPDYYAIAKSKTKWAVWFVSNCKPPSRRQEYVQQMQKVMDVDIYGGCGKPCSASFPMCTPDFVKYRYYLSFENSLCTDYVTEKLFKTFSADSHFIPVVRGALDYDKYLPLGTFIDSAQFPNATMLAVFLKRLGEDPKAYSEYLRRKDMYKAMDNSGIGSLGCKACEYLHTNKVQVKTYDMKKWMGDNHCHEPDDL